MGNERESWKGEYPIERTGARRFRPATVASDQSRLSPPLQKIDWPE